MVDATYAELYVEVSRQVADAIDEAAAHADTVSAAGPARDQRGTSAGRRSPGETKGPAESGPDLRFYVERTTGFEPATPTLARRLALS
jgi:hypothetical protein